MKELWAPLDDGHCFGCGQRSEIGLKMRFAELEDGSVECRLVLAAPYQGWQGAAHGGIVALLLDEGMAYAAAARGHRGVTAELKMRFRKAVPIGVPLVVRGKVLWQRREVLGLEASVRDEEGTLLASGQGSFVSRGRLAPGERFGESSFGG
ncbi:MAG: PaaI family thioesterase [Candidatus Baltobacteraceae bacterium]